MPCYESITDLVEAGGVDVVDICTPTFLHRDNVMESLSLGKTTIVEKPCALTRADAEAMFALAGEKGVNLYVAQVLQFTREIEVLRKLVREGHLRQAPGRGVPAAVRPSGVGPGRLAL